MTRHGVVFPECKCVNATKYCSGGKLSTQNLDRKPTTLKPKPQTRDHVDQALLHASQWLYVTRNIRTCARLAWEGMQAEEGCGLGMGGCGLRFVHCGGCGFGFGVLELKCGVPSTRESGFTGVPRSQENALPQDPAVGSSLGPYDGPRGGTVSHERGTPAGFRVEGIRVSGIGLMCVRQGLRMCARRRGGAG